MTSIIFFSFLCCCFFLFVCLFFFLILCVFLVCLVYPMLPVYLDCPFLIVPSVFSNVYLINIFQLAPGSMGFELCVTKALCIGQLQWKKVCSSHKSKGQTKDNNICICCLSAKYTSLRRKHKAWLARNQANVSESGDMSVRGLLFLELAL